FLYYILKFQGRKTLYFLLLILLFAFLLLLSKFYYLVALLPGAAALIWSMNKKNILLKFAATHVLWLSVLFCLRFAIPDYDVALIISFKQNNFINMAVSDSAGSLM